MKKLIKIFFSIIISLTILFFNCSRKDSVTYKFVNVRAGLRIREKPNLESKKIVLLPFCVKVKVLSEKNETVTIDKIHTYSDFRFHPSDFRFYPYFLTDPCPYTIHL